MFVEGCIHNDSTVSKQLLNDIVYHVILRIITDTINSNNCNDDTINSNNCSDDSAKIALFGAVDLLFRMKNNLPIEQLIVS